jgi:diaminopimelate epimerase
MGKPNFKWDKIPLSKEMNYKNLNIKIDSKDGKEIIGGFSLSVGNPHVIFFVENVDNFNLNEIGPKIENHNYFPQKCNVTIANVKNMKQVKVRVWERGAGLTKACGTAACATGVASAVLKLTDKETSIEFQEGSLNIDWYKDNNIYMTGKVSEVKKITVNI